MTTKLKTTALALMLALLVSAPAFAQDFKTPGSAPSEVGGKKPGESDSKCRSSPLVGAWRMTSLEVNINGQLQPVPYSGQIIFTKSCTVSVQAMNPNADAPATPYTVNGYEAFYGTVTVDKKANTVVMTVESSLVRNLIGQQLTRVFEVRGDTLVLTPSDPAEGFRVTYERISR